MIPDVYLHFTIGFLLIAVLGIAYVQYKTGQSDTYLKSVSDTTKTIYNIFKGKPSEPNPYNTIGFVKSLTDILHTLSSIKQKELYQAWYPEPGHCIIEFIGIEENMLTALEAFKRCVETALQAQGYAPVIYGESETISSKKWHIHIYFGSTPEGKEKVYSLMQRKQDLQRKTVLDSLDAPIDEDIGKDLKNRKMSGTHKIMLGFNLTMYQQQGIKVPLYATSDLIHSIVVGGSGSGKSTWLLYFIYQIKRSIPNCELVICDFKKSGELKGITSHYAEYVNCIEEIRLFHREFLSAPEGGGGITRILIIDEIAGLLNHLGMTKEGKKEADEIRMIMSSILMLGRSKRRFVVLSMQRYTASIFPTSSGSADNFSVVVGLGKLSVDGRRGLFAGEHFADEDEITFGMGKGLLLRDGHELCGIQVPNLDKHKLLQILQAMNR